MNYFLRKYKTSLVTAAVVFQLIFPQFSQAVVRVNAGPAGSLLAVANSPQPIIFDAHNRAIPSRLPLADSREARRKIKLIITAYSSTPDQTDSTPFITANGSRVRDGIVAANFLPFGAKIKIPELYGDKVFSVEDRMNPRYYYRLDIWLPTRAEAKRFGVKYVEVEIF